MKIELTRHNVCQLANACSGLIFDMKQEFMDENTTEDRKKVLEGSIKMWKELKDNIMNQLKEYDNKHQEQ